MEDAEAKAAPPQGNVAEGDAMDTGEDGRKTDMHNSSTSLDKYVGKGRNSKYMTLLPEDFEPGDMDVLCGRGKRCFNSPGNQRFRKLVAARAEDYAAATTRTDKTFIVCSIVSEIRKASPKGGFVKKDSTTGRWYEVGDFNAHEKTSQMFRDVLHESYLSSNKSKKKRRDLFRTNSKRRALMQQQQHAKSINASAGRFLRGNGVARHHSYGSVKRAVGANQYDLLQMRANSQQQYRSSGQSVHSGHESWHNSFQSNDGIKSEPGIILSANPRLAFAGRRQNSLGDLGGSVGDLNSSYGELQAQDQFHNSFGEFTNNNDLTGAANFHNSCVEFPSSFQENTNQISPQDFHNSFGEFNTNANLTSRNNDNGEFNINPDDLHNSFGELRSNQMYRNNNGLSPNPDVDSKFAHGIQPVPLSISVPEGAPSSAHPGKDIQTEQFQLEFETDENSGSQNRARGRMPETGPLAGVGAAQPQQQPDAMSNVNIFDALAGAYGNASQSNNDDNPFEPVPLPGMES